MPGVAVPEDPAVVVVGPLEAAEDRGGHGGHAQSLDQVVAAVDDDVRAEALPRVGAQHTAQLAHRRRGPQVVPDDVADGHPHRAVGQRQQVVPVAADLGAVGGGE